MSEIAVARSFLRAAQRFGAQDRARIFDFVAKFYENPARPGTNLEVIEGARGDAAPGQGAGVQGRLPARLLPGQPAVRARTGGSRRRGGKGGPGTRTASALRRHDPGPR